MQPTDESKEGSTQTRGLPKEEMRPSKGMILFITLIMVTSSFLSGSLLTQINLVFGILLASVIVIGIGWSSATMILGKVRLNSQLLILLLLTVSALCSGIYVGLNYI